MYLAMNDVVHGRIEYARTLDEAKAVSWPDCRPNIIVAGDGRAWVKCAYPDGEPQWFETTTTVLRYQAALGRYPALTVAALDLAARNFEVAGTVGRFSGVR